MKWWMKWGITSTLAYLPGGRILHQKILRRFGELAHISASTRFGNTEILLDMARRWCGGVNRQRVVELGTGWVPAVPTGFGLAGAQVETFDVVPLVTDEIFFETRRLYTGRTGALSVASGTPEKIIRQRLQQIEEAAGFTESCHILDGRYLAPFDTTSLPFDDGEIDLVVSNLVLQCIPKDILPLILAESWRILKPRGIALHRIWMSDEYAPDESSGRNQLEYLKYPEHIWERWFNNSLKHVNRLRATQFLELFSEQGFICRECQRQIDYDSIPHLQQLNIAAPFKHLSLEELATVGINVVLEKNPGWENQPITSTNHECGSKY